MARSIVALLTVLLLAWPAWAQQKKRVAVLDFEYGTVRSYVASIFGTDQDVGKGIADLIVEKLVADGTYSVIERRAVDKIIAEQNFSQSDRADSTTAARLGRILGVDAIVMGSITQFGRDDKSTGLAGGALSRVTGRYGLGGVKRTESKAVVGISARVVDTETAEVLVTAKGLGESRRTGTNLLGSGGGSVAAGGAVDMTSKNFAATILGEAVNQAVVQLGQELVSGQARLPTRKLVLEGQVADVTGNTVILNLGSRAGLKLGDRLQVRRKVRDVRDPATGKILRSLDDKIGEVVITEVDERSAVGTFTGVSPPKVGDLVRN